MADGPEIDEIWQQCPNCVGKTPYDNMGKLIIAVAIQKKFIKQECCKLWQFSLSTASSCLMLESNEMNANMQESKVIFNHLQYSRGIH
jgi:hypothetical protein